MGYYKSKSSKKHPPFVMLTIEMLKGMAWRKLGPFAQAVYIYLRTEYNGSNNGKIKLPYSDLYDLFSPETISHALRILEKQGWIKVVKRGGLFKGCSVYKLTGKHDPDVI